VPRAIPLTCAPLAVLPTCSGDVDLGQRGHQGAAQGGGVYAGLCSRARRKQTPKGGRRVGGGSFFFFCPYSVSHPPFAPFVSAEAVAAAAAAAAGPAPSRRALSSQQGAL